MRSVEAHTTGAMVRAWIPRGPEAISRIMKTRNASGFAVCPRVGCCKVLPELDEQGQSDAKVWAELVAEYGMEGAKALADDLAAM